MIISVWCSARCNLRTRLQHFVSKTRLNSHHYSVSSCQTCPSVPWSSTPSSLSVSSLPMETNPTSAVCSAYRVSYQTLKDWIHCVSKVLRRIVFCQNFVVENDCSLHNSTLSLCHLCAKKTFRVGGNFKMFWQVHICCFFISVNLYSKLFAVTSEYLLHMAVWSVWQLQRENLISVPGGSFYV